MMRHFTQGASLMTHETGGQKPAMTIVVQSWATPIAAAVMLVIGLLAGYFGRPLLQKDETASATRTPAAAATPVAIPTAASAAGVTVPQISSAEELMAYLVSQATHFKGDADAPVTIVEFSDFQ
jgi:protein-disulfide isomerase